MDDFLYKRAQLRYADKDIQGSRQDLLEYVKCVPSEAGAWHLLGLCEFALKRYADAAAFIRKATALNPSKARYHYNLGTVLHKLGNIDEAISSFRQSLSIQPDYTQALNNCAALLFYTGCLSESEAMCRQSIQISPTSYEPYVNLGNTLRDQGRIAESIKSYRAALQLKPNQALVGSNLLLAMHYSSDYDQQDIFAEHISLGKDIESRCAAIALTNSRDRDFLNIGYVSSDFREHSVSSFFEPIVTNHNRDRFHVFCYYNGPIKDSVTARLMQQAFAWRDISDLDDSQCARLIKDDEIDILVDLSGHTGGNRLSLFACKPAPIQITYLGYPDTTGLKSIDYRITDLLADPPGREQWYSEQLLRLTNGFLCYQPPLDSPLVKPAPFLKNNFITFGSFNTLPKISLQVVELWAQVLQSIPGAHLVIKNRQMADSALRTRLLDQLCGLGVDRGAVELLAPTRDRSAHLSEYNRVDIALDTYPYNGTTTTFESLWMGVPVITLVGATHASRVGYSILINLGMEYLCATDAQQYTKIAASLAENREQLLALRARLRGDLNKSVLCDGPRFTADLEKMYQEIKKTKKC